MLLSVLIFSKQYTKTVHTQQKYVTMRSVVNICYNHSRYWQEVAIVTKKHYLESNRVTVMPNSFYSGGMCGWCEWSAFLQHLLAIANLPYVLLWDWVASSGKNWVEGSYQTRQDLRCNLCVQGKIGHAENFECGKSREENVRQINTHSVVPRKAVWYLSGFLALGAGDDLGGSNQIAGFICHERGVVWSTS